jgi:hypothetical protein
MEKVIKLSKNKKKSIKTKKKTNIRNKQKNTKKTKKTSKFFFKKMEQSFQLTITVGCATYSKQYNRRNLAHISDVRQKN